MIKSKNLILSLSVLISGVSFIEANAQTTVNVEQLIKSSKSTANLKFMNGSEQATVLQRNGRRKIDSLCHHEEGSTNTSEELKDTKNQNRNKNQNKNKNRNQSKNKNNSVLRNSGGVRVLVPGAGLGRLASELAVLGYSVEANDCSGENHNSDFVSF